MIKRFPKQPVKVMSDKDREEFHKAVLKLKNSIGKDKGKT